MFAFVSAFPKSLHCTDEAQHSETVLSAVLSIYIYMIRKEGSQNKLQVEKYIYKLIYIYIYIYISLALFCFQSLIVAPVWCHTSGQARKAVKLCFVDQTEQCHAVLQLRGRL